jgi:hypothetical protein
VKLTLEAETEMKVVAIGLAIRMKGGRVYSQRHPTTYATLVEAVKSHTGSEPKRFERGVMMDNGEFILET